MDYQVDPRLNDVLRSNAVARGPDDQLFDFLLQQPLAITRSGLSWVSQLGATEEGDIWWVIRIQAAQLHVIAFRAHPLRANSER